MSFTFPWSFSALEIVLAPFKSRRNLGKSAGCIPPAFADDKMAVHIRSFNKQQKTAILFLSHGFPFALFVVSVYLGNEA